MSTIILKGVTEIKPADNENSLVFTFWNDASLAVASAQDIGINQQGEVIIWGPR